MQLYKLPSFLIIALCVLLISCNNTLPAPEGDAISMDDIPDLIDYLDDIQKHFDEGRISKTIVHNGKQEQLWIDDADWQEQMDFFYSSRISSMQLEDNYYKVQQNQGDTTFMVVQAKSPSLFTRKLVWAKVQDEIVSLEIVNQRSTFLFELEQNLTWHANGNAEIAIRQKSIFSESVHTNITMDFR